MIHFSKIKNWLITFGIVLIFISATDHAWCQVSGVSVVNDLSFGNVLGGVPKKVDKGTPGAAAEFLVTGIAGSDVTIEFALPTYMNDGTYNMQMIFNNTDCAMDSSSSPDQTSPDYDNLDPWDVNSYTIGSGGITIWLGSKVVPRLLQDSGDYTADIVVTVTFIAK